MKNKLLMMVLLLFGAFLAVDGQRKYELPDSIQIQLAKSDSFACSIVKQTPLGLWIKYKEGFALIDNSFLNLNEIELPPSICQGPQPLLLTSDSLPQAVRTYSTEPAGWKMLMRMLWESEVPGSEDNWIIQHIIRHAMLATDIYLPPDWISDRLPSCAVAVIYAESAAGRDVSYLNFKAISFLNYGTTVHSLKEAQFGDIVVFWRITPDRWESHAGYLLGVIGDKVMILGGNQSDRIGIDAYPISRIREGGIRRPPK